MPSVPWKKAKAKAISKFVVDRLQSSSKHGGSLVVQTGFPTSVVHLYVKNRDRLKKTLSKSKNPTLDLIPPIPPIPSAAGDGDGNPPSTPPPLLFSPPPANFLLPPTPLVQQQQQEAEEGGGDVCQGDCNSTMLFMAMLKMFFVVLLAFATSKFVLGITLSAFSLLFMEYAGKHLFRLLFSSSSFKSKPKLDDDNDESSPPPPPPPPLQCMCIINKSLSSLSFYKSLQCFITMMNLFSRQHANGEDDQDDEEDFKAPPPPPPSQQQQQGTTTTYELTTTTTSEYKSNGISAPTLPRPPRKRRIPSVASEPDLLNWANRQQQQQASQEDEDGRNDVVLDKETAAYTSCDDFSESSSSDLKKRTSRRSKIKSKIKRLVSSKLKNKKRSKESSGAGNKAAASLFSSSTTSLDEDKLNTSCTRRMELVKFNQQFGNKGDDELSMSSSTGDNVICFSNELFRAGTENGTTTTTTTTTSTSSVILLREEEEEEKPTASKISSSGYLIFFAMVLVGLVGGKALAIAFTLSWCLLLKSCGSLKGRMTKSVAADDDDDAATSSSTSS